MLSSDKYDKKEDLIENSQLLPTIRVMNVLHTGRYFTGTKQENRYVYVFRIISGFPGSAVPI